MIMMEIVMALQISVSDITQDGVINILDIVTLVNIILDS